jgi:hypothetical protein
MVSSIREALNDFKEKRLMPETSRYVKKYSSEKMICELSKKIEELL